MGQKEKAIKRLLDLPTDIRFDELVQILGFFQYELTNKGKTSGSRVQFFRQGYPSIKIHKPHNGKCVWKWDLEAIVKMLKEVDLL